MCNVCMELCMAENDEYWYSSRKKSETFVNESG